MTKMKIGFYEAEADRALDPEDGRALKPHHAIGFEAAQEIEPAAQAPRKDARAKAPQPAKAAADLGDAALLELAGLGDRELKATGRILPRKLLVFLN